MAITDVLLGSSGSSQSALALYRQYQKNGPQMIADFRERPEIKRAVEAFRTAAAEADSVDAFLKDNKAVTFVMKAFYFTGDPSELTRGRRVLTESLDDPRALANRDPDQRWYQMAEAFDFAGRGTQRLGQEGFINDLVDRFVQNEFERSLGEQNDAVRQAVFFRRQVGSVSSTFEILGNQVLRSVVTQTLGLPQQIALQSVQKQRDLIDTRLDVSKFTLENDAADSVDPTTLVARSVSVLNAIDRGTQQIGDLAARIAQLRTDYLATEKTLANPPDWLVTELPVQQDAIPGLIDLKGRFAAARADLGAARTDTTALGAILEEALDVAAYGGDLSTFKAEFADLAADLAARVSDPDFGAYDGQSLLGTGTPPGPAAVVIDSYGNTATAKGRSVDPFLARLADVAARVASAEDAAALGAARTALNGTVSELGTLTGRIEGDEAAFGTALAKVATWGNRLDGVDLSRGATTARAAEAGIKTIGTLLGQIRTLAESSANLAPEADRTTLETKFADLKQQITDAIAKAGENGENLLSGIAGDSYSYGVFGAETVGARQTGLDAVLDGVLSGSLSDAASATALADAIRTTANPALAQAGRTIATDRSAVVFAAETLDARGALDARYRAITTTLNVTLGSEGLGDDDLLANGASNLVLEGEGLTGVTVTAYGTLSADISKALTAGLAALPGATMGAGQTAWTKLTDAMLAIDSALSKITRERDSVVQFRDAAQAQVDAAPTAYRPEDVKSTEYTEKFIEKFLALYDAGMLGGSVGAGNASTFGTSAALSILV